jgi:hypothetical protein
MTCAEHFVQTAHRSAWVLSWALAVTCAACSDPAQPEVAPTAQLADAPAVEPAPFSEHAEDVEDAWEKKAQDAHRKWNGYALGLDGDNPNAEAPKAPTPADYLRLHNIATDPRTAEWDEALAELATTGDDYTLIRLRELDRAALTAESAAILDRTIAALTARGLGSDRAPTAAEIEARLERAAWADIHCDRCETTLVPWATQSVAPFADDPAVRAELVRLRDAYKPRFEAETQWSSLSARVREYARKLLEGQGGQPATKSP